MWKYGLDDGQIEIHKHYKIKMMHIGSSTSDP